MLELQGSAVEHNCRLVVTGDTKQHHSVIMAATGLGGAVFFASAIKSGKSVTLTLDAFPGENFAGILVRDSNSIDLTSRTLRVEVDVDNPTGSLLPGAYAFDHWKLPSAAQAVTIPTNTLLFRAEGLRVAVVRGGQPKLVPVTIGHDYGSSVEVLSGLASEDTAILNPSDSIMEGSPVKIAETANPEGPR